MRLEGTGMLHPRWAFTNGPYESQTPLGAVREPPAPDRVDTILALISAGVFKTVKRANRVSRAVRYRGMTGRTRCDG